MAKLWDRVRRRFGGREEQEHDPAGVLTEAADRPAMLSGDTTAQTAVYGRPDGMLESCTPAPPASAQSSPVHAVTSEVAEQPLGTPGTPGTPGTAGTQGTPPAEPSATLRVPAAWQPLPLDASLSPFDVAVDVGHADVAQPEAAISAASLSSNLPDDVTGDVTGARAFLPPELLPLMPDTLLAASPTALGIAPDAPAQGTISPDENVVVVNATVENLAELAEYATEAEAVEPPVYSMAGEAIDVPPAEEAAFDGDDGADGADGGYVAPDEDVDEDDAPVAFDDRMDEDDEGDGEHASMAGIADAARASGVSVRRRRGKRGAPVEPGELDGQPARLVLPGRPLKRNEVPTVDTPLFVWSHDASGAVVVRPMLYACVQTQWYGSSLYFLVIPWAERDASDRSARLVVDASQLRVAPAEMTH